VDRNRAIQPKIPLLFHSPRTQKISYELPTQTGKNKHFWCIMDKFGISWDFMEVNGKRPQLLGFTGENSEEFK
jgi:hypothetical protein